MTKQKGLKAIIISLLIVLSTTCFSLLFTNAYTSFSKEEPQAASTWNFDSGGFGNGNFWDVLKEVFAGITYKDTVTYNSYTNFEISSEKGFIAFAGSVSEGYDFAGKTVTLTTDLDFSGDAFLPVGAKINTSNGNISSYEDTTNSFCGTFDGGSHTISNITLNSTWKSSSAFEGSTAIGVFCMVGASSANVSSWSSSASYNCVIKNLHVNNMSVTESNVATSIGAIAGAMGTMNYGYNSNTVTIQNCAVTNFNVSLYNNTSMSCVGGLVGISRVYNPSSCTAPVIKDCLVYSMNVTNQTRTCNEVSALTPAHGVYYSGVYLYYCPFYTITRCVNYEDSVDSASLYFYPDSDGDFSYHMSTLENYYGSNEKTNYPIYHVSSNFTFKLFL